MFHLGYSLGKFYVVNNIWNDSTKVNFISILVIHVNHSKKITPLSQHPYFLTISFESLVFGSTYHLSDQQVFWVSGMELEEHPIMKLFLLCWTLSTMMFFQVQATYPNHQVIIDWLGQPDPTPHAAVVATPGACWIGQGPQEHGRYGGLQCCWLDLNFLDEIQFEDLMKDDPIFWNFFKSSNWI